MGEIEEVGREEPGQHEDYYQNSSEKQNIERHDHCNRQATYAHNPSRLCKPLYSIHLGVIDSR